jgi:hypothetical protein
VHRRENEVSRLGGLKRRLRRLGVTQLADEDDVRVLPEYAPERLVERLRVESDLALVDDAALVGMEDLYGVLDGDDVLPACAVDMPEHRSKRRRLADARRPGNEDQAAVLVGQIPHTLGESKLIEGRNFVGDCAKRERDVAALPEGVHAEARELRLLVSGVELAGLVEGGQSRRSRCAHSLENLLELGCAERRPALERAQ